MKLKTDEFQMFLYETYDFLNFHFYYKNIKYKVIFLKNYIHVK